MIAKEIMDAAVAAAQQVRRERRPVRDAVAAWWTGVKLEKQRKRCRSGRHDFTGYKEERLISVYDVNNPQGKRPIYWERVYKAVCMHCGMPSTVTQREG